MADVLTCESENQRVVVTHTARRPKGHFKSSPVQFLRYIFTFHFNDFYLIQILVPASITNLLPAFISSPLILQLLSVRKTDQKVKKWVGSGQGNMEEQFCRKSQQYTPSYLLLIGKIPCHKGLTLLTC